MSQLKIQSVLQAHEHCLNDHNHIILDVRTPSEWQKGIADGAMCLCLDDIMENAQQQLDLDTTYYVMCQNNTRSALAINQLQTIGFSKIIQVDEGFKGWQNNNLPIANIEIDQNDLRYQRHYQLEGFGREAQTKLLSAHVLLIGLGGLGSSTAYYLAAAGVGEITLIDDDSVSLSNLQRQIIHTTSAIGVPKVKSAKHQLLELNPQIKINTIENKIDKSNSDKLINSVDIVIDGSDNLNTRYLVNHQCLKYHKPLVYAAVYQYEAQISVFNFKDSHSACLKCLFPQTKGFEPDNCSTVGVLGVVPGMAGIMQASEAIKLITNTGKVLSSKLLVIDLLNNDFRTISYKKNSNCDLH